MQNGNAPFLTKADRVIRAIRLNVARGDNQTSNRLCCKDGSQGSDRAENGYAIHHATLQPGIVIEKANGPESKVRMVQQCPQDELPTLASTVDERGLTS